MYSQLPLFALGLAQVGSAAWLHQGENSKWSPPRQTSEAEQADKAFDSVSPAPTSRPKDLEQMGDFELFRRQTTLPDFTASPDTCGYYVGFSTNSYTCFSSGQSCVTFANTRFRGCCSGTQCSTFATTCVPSSRLSSGQSCASGTTCCSNSNNPNCGTIYFSSLATPSVTQQIIQCWATTFDATYRMQDIPPSLLSTKTTTTSKTTTSTDTTTTSPNTPAVPGQTEPSRESDANAGSNNVPAIVGGVVGGVAGIALIVGAVVFLLLHKKKSKNSPQPGEGFPPGGPVGGPMGGSMSGAPTATSSPPPMMAGAYAAAPMSQYDAIKPPGQQQFYDPRYSYQPVSNPGVAGYPPSTINGSQSPQPSYVQSMHSPGPYQSTVSQVTPPPQPGYLAAGGVQGQYPMGPPSQHAVEMPATNPVGSEANRAEMWSGPPDPAAAEKR